MRQPIKITDNIQRDGNVAAEVLPSRAGDISALASANAPFISFETVPFSSALEDGIGSISLAVQRDIALSTIRSCQIRSSSGT